MRGSDDDILSASLTQHLDSAGDGAAGVNHVVDEQTGLTGDLADHAVGDNLVRDIDGTGLVNEGQRGVAQGVGPLLGNLHTAGVRGDHDQVVQGVVLLDVLRQNRHGVHVIDRAVEEALDLVGVEVHGDDAVSAGGLEQVCDQASGNRLTATVLLVLAGVWEERQDSGDALGRTALERVNHNQLLDEPLVQRCRVRLQYEGIGTADGFLVAHEDFAVGKITSGHRSQLCAELLGNCLAQFRVCPSGEEHEVLLVIDPLAGHLPSSLPGLPCCCQRCQLPAPPALPQQQRYLDASARPIPRCCADGHH